MTLQASEMIRLLEVPSADRRTVVKQITRKAPIEEVTAALRQASSPDTRELLCDIAGFKEDLAAIPVLLENVQDPAVGVRCSAADALGKICMANPGADREWEQVGRTLMAQFVLEPEDSVKQLLAAALGSAQCRPAIPLLVDALSSPSEMLRACAAWSLGHMKATQARSDLERAIQTETGASARDRITAALQALAEA